MCESCYFHQNVVDSVGCELDVADDICHAAHPTLHAIAIVLRQLCKAVFSSFSEPKEAYKYT